MLWWDKTVDFEHTWGDERSLPPVPAVDAAALVRAALAEPASWSTQLPQGGEALVTLASTPTTDVLAHPLGTLTVSQRVAPLGLRLDHVDGRPVAPGTVVTIDAARVGGVLAPPPAPAMAPFPRARFQDLTEDERLTQKTFESLPAGARIEPPGQTNPAGTRRRRSTSSRSTWRRSTSSSRRRPTRSRSPTVTSAGTWREVRPPPRRCASTSGSGRRHPTASSTCASRRSSSSITSTWRRPWR